MKGTESSSEKDTDRERILGKEEKGKWIVGWEARKGEGGGGDVCEEFDKFWRGKNFKGRNITYGGNDLH